MYKVQTIDLLKYFKRSMVQTQFLANFGAPHSFYSSSEVVRTFRVFLSHFDLEDYSRRLSRVVQCRSFLTVIFIHAVYRVLRRCVHKKDSRFIIMKLKGEICVNERGLSPKRRSIGCVVFSQVSHLS